MCPMAFPADTVLNIRFDAQNNYVFMLCFLPCCQGLSGNPAFYPPSPNAGRTAQWFSSSLIFPDYCPFDSSLFLVSEVSSSSITGPPFDIPKRSCKTLSQTQFNISLKNRNTPVIHSHVVMPRHCRNHVVADFTVQPVAGVIVKNVNLCIILDALMAR